MKISVEDQIDIIFFNINLKIHLTLILMIFFYNKFSNFCNIETIYKTVIVHQHYNNHFGHSKKIFLE